MKKKCLLINPVSNGKCLAEFLKSKEIEVYALIELSKVQGANQLTEEKKKRNFDPTLYSGVFIDETQLLSSELSFDCILPGSECGVETGERLAKLFGCLANDASSTEL